MTSRALDPQFLNKIGAYSGTDMVMELISGTFVVEIWMTWRGSTNISIFRPSSSYTSSSFTPCYKENNGRTLGGHCENTLVYDFYPGVSDLVSLGMMAGFIISELTLGLFSDSYATRKARPRPNGIAKPENRLPPLILGALLLPASLLLYGWMLQHRTMWLAPVVGSGLVSFASMYSYIPVQIYVVDVYTLHTASATGAMSIVRSAIAAAVPLGADPLYRRLGYGWGYTLLAGLALPFIGIAVVLVRYGERVRRLDSAVE